MISLMLSICAIGCLLLAVLVLLRDARLLVNWLAAAINVCFAIWSIAILVFLQATTVGSAFIAAKVYYVVAALFVGLLTLFAYIFPRGTKIPGNVTNITTISCATVVALIALVPEFITGKAIVSASGNYILVESSSYLFFVVYFITFFVLGIGVILRKFLKSERRMRIQTGVYLFGILFMAIPGLVTNLLLPYFQDYSLIWVAPAMASVFLLIVSYGIIRHGLFDIRLAAVRSLAYILSIGTLIGGYYGLAFLISNLFLDKQYTFDRNPMMIIIALGLSLIFQPLKRFFDRLSNRIFYRDNYNTDDFFARINRLLSSTTDIQSLLEHAAKEIGETLKSEQVFFFIHTREDRHVQFGTHRHTQLPLKDAHSIEKSHGVSSEAILASELRKNDPLYRMMASHRVAVILPLRKKKQLIGYLCLGDHQSSRYTQRDLKVLSTLADELIIAIENALSVQDIKELNATLQQRIDYATKELRATNAQLHRLDEAKDEFVSMASHQLRTPLTSVKGYISMVLEGDVGEITASQKQLLEEAFNSSERMVRLIGDFLNVSRLQTGKFVIDAHPADLAKVVSEELESLAPNAQTRGLAFEYDPPTDIPLVSVDEGKLRQVIMNFADNALYYSTEDTRIVVSLTMDKGAIEFLIKDTGIGVPLDEQQHLFTKFFRATNAKKQRPDGTGVGLFLAKKVIDAHGGTIIFESQMGKGSTFGFRLPLNKLPAVNDAN